jgi:hypothetical protein
MEIMAVYSEIQKKVIKSCVDKMVLEILKLKVHLASIELQRLKPVKKKSMKKESQKEIRAPCPSQFRVFYCITISVSP